MKSKVRIAPKPVAVAPGPLQRLEDVLCLLQGIALGLREHHDEWIPDPTDPTKANRVFQLYEVLLDSLDLEIKALEARID